MAEVLAISFSLTINLNIDVIVQRRSQETARNLISYIVAV